MIPFMQTVQTKQVHRNGTQKTGGCQELGREKKGVGTQWSEFSLRG